jgi:hypothetical protein
MGLFDFGTDASKSAARKAADAAKQAAKKAHKQLKKGEKKSIRSLTAAEGKGTAALQRGEEKAIETTNLGYDRSRADQLAGKVEGVGYIDQGKTEALGKQQDALDLYKPVMDQANAGATAYGNFYGLGGQEGFDRAQSDWQASPLYQSMVGESSLGQQSLDRQAAGRGNPYNGADTLKYQGQLAGRYLNDYTAGLRPYLDQQGNLLGQQSNIYGNMANTITGAAGQMGNMAYGTGQNLGNLGYNTGANQGNIYTGTGSNISNLAQGIGTTKATGVYMPTAQGAAGLQMQKGQAESDMFANITAANNAAQQNKWGLINSAIGAAGKIGTAYAGG